MTWKWWMITTKQIHGLENYISIIISVRRHSKLTLMTKSGSTIISQFPMISLWKKEIMWWHFDEVAGIFRWDNEAHIEKTAQLGDIHKVYFLGGYRENGHSTLRKREYKNADVLYGCVLVLFCKDVFRLDSSNKWQKFIVRLIFHWTVTMNFKSVSMMLQFIC